MSESSKTFEHLCIIKVDLQTNCPQGGDTGHGGRTTIRVANEGSTDMKVHAHGDEEFLIRLGGDAEAEVFAEAFEWAGKELRRLIDSNRNREAR
jgi:hypothetical protein